MSALTRSRAAAFSSVLLACSACADAAPRAELAVADSAGIQIVTNLPGSIEGVEAWSLSPEPVAELGGGADADVPLHQISDVKPLGGDRVAIGNASPPHGLLLRTDGTVMATLGREGRGPGEFSTVTSIVPLAADSLAVWDANRRRLSVFAVDGRYVRDVDLSSLVPISPEAASGTTTPAAFTELMSLESGSLVMLVIGVWGSSTPGQDAGVHRETMPSPRFDATGQELASYGPFPGYELYRDPAMGLGPYPFGAATDGASSGDLLVVGTAVAPELRFYAPDGNLQRIVRWPDHGRAAEGNPLVADFSAWIDAQLAGVEPGEQGMFREILEAMPTPELLPAYRDVIGGEDQQIWVGEYPGQLDLLGFTPEVRRMPARRWLVFDSDGSLAATVGTPGGFQPYAVHDGRVWGVYRDELDVESVRAYGILRPS